MKIWLKTVESKERDYQRQVDSANEFKKSYIASMESLFEALNRQEKERIDNIIDQTQKLLIYQTSKDMNMKYDVKTFNSVSKMTVLSIFRPLKK
jgi:hypothetical protein